MHDEDAAALLAPLPEEDRFSTWHLAEPDGSLASRGAGAAALLEHLGAGLLAGLARSGEGALDRLYEIVARNRDRLGRFVPDGAAPRRFP